MGHQANPTATRIFETVFISPPTLTEAELGSVVTSQSIHGSLP